MTPSQSTKHKACLLNSNQQSTPKTITALSGIHKIVQAVVKTTSQPRKYKIGMLEISANVQKFGSVPDLQGNEMKNISINEFMNIYLYVLAIVATRRQADATERDWTFERELDRRLFDAILAIHSWV